MIKSIEKFTEDFPDLRILIDKKVKENKFERLRGMNTYQIDSYLEARLLCTYFEFIYDKIQADKGLLLGQLMLFKIDVKELSNNFTSPIKISEYGARFNMLISYLTQNGLPSVHTKIKDSSRFNDYFLANRYLDLDTIINKLDNLKNFYKVNKKRMGMPVELSNYISRKLVIIKDDKDLINDLISYRLLDLQSLNNSTVYPIKLRETINISDIDRICSFLERIILILIVHYKSIHFYNYMLNYKH